MSLSSVREEQQLSVLFQNDDLYTIEIWMTNDIIETNAMSWSKFLRIDLNDHLLLDGLSFFLDEENKVAVICEGYLPDYDINTSIYIIGEDVGRIVEPGPFWPRLISYVPSLVQI